MPFAGLRVLCLESRRAKEMEALIRREGGVPFIAPAMQERALADATDALRFLERLEAGEFDMFICMTGTGLNFLRNQIANHFPVERLSAALGKVTVLSRGPKPLPVLREMGLRADVLIPEPNTWKEIVAGVSSRPERRIAIQEHGRPNLALNRALEALGASVTPVAVYRWELPHDMEPLRSSVQKLAERQLDVVLFTSSIQLDHLLQLARDMGKEAEVLRAFHEYTVAASVGPVMTESLKAAGIPVDVEPVHPKMAPLVKLAAEKAHEAIAKKRA